MEFFQNKIIWKVIKDISKEEQSHLYLAGVVKREQLQLTETDRGEAAGGAGGECKSFSYIVVELYRRSLRLYITSKVTVKCLTSKYSVNFDSKLPLRYYNNLANSMKEKELGAYVDTRQVYLD